MTNEIAISTKTVLMSGDIHEFHFDNLRSAISFIDSFEELMKCVDINDDVEATYVSFSDGLNTVETVL